MAPVVTLVALVISWAPLGGLVYLGRTASLTLLTIQQNENKTLPASWGLHAE